MDKVRRSGVKGAIIGSIGSLMLFPPLGFAAIALTIAGGFIGRKLAEDSEPESKETPEKHSRASSSSYSFDSFKPLLPKVDYFNLFPEKQPSLYKPLPEIKLDYFPLFQKEPSYMDRIIKQQEEVIRPFSVIRESESSLLNNFNIQSLSANHGTARTVSGMTTDKKSGTASSNNASGLTGARGSLKNEEYFQRHGR